MTVDQIREAMADRKIKYVAKKIGVSAQALYNILSHKNEPSLRIYQLLVDYFSGDTNAND